MKKIFLSSVQKEFAAERKYLKDYIEKNPILRRFFRVFAFEIDIPAADKKTDEVYLAELAKSDIYISLIGNDYGFEDAGGISPTEREFDEATRLGLQRLIFVKGTDDSKRSEKEQAFLRKISPELIRRRFVKRRDLEDEISRSLDKILDDGNAYRTRPFDETICEKATLDDIDEEKIRWFLQVAKRERNFPLPENTPVSDVLTHLELYSNGQINNAGILLFGKGPQHYILSSEVKCLYWYGTERIKPIASYKIFNGNLFDLSDQAVDFVMSKLDRRIGTRSHGPMVDSSFDIDESIVTEAINNALAHRNYLSSASIQIELYSDRLEVFSPGPMHPEMAQEKLYKTHRSYPMNPLIAKPLYLAKYIETIGSGTTDIVKKCKETGLPTPKFEATDSSFLLTIYRPADRNAGRTIFVPESGGDDSMNASVNASVKIVELLSENNRLTAANISHTLGLSLRTIYKKLAQLQQDGILKRMGSDRDGCWLITERKSFASTNTLTIKSEQKSRQKSEQKILELLSKQPSMTTSELAAALNMSRSGVMKNIKCLKEANLLKRVGGDRGGHWEIIEKSDEQTE